MPRTRIRIRALRATVIQGLDKETFQVAEISLKNLSYISGV